MPHKQCFPLVLYWKYTGVVKTVLDKMSLPQQQQNVTADLLSETSLQSQLHGGDSFKLITKFQIYTHEFLSSNSIIIGCKTCQYVTNIAILCWYDHTLLSWKKLESVS